MSFVMQIVMASALLALGAAAPTVQKRSAFTIHQTANPGHVKNGTAARIKALTKFGAAPEEISGALTATGSVTATPYHYDAEYLCPVTIGHQTFTLNFDTGSANLWVFASETGFSRNYYRPGPTAKALPGSTFRVNYSDRSNARGWVFTDNVDIGGITVIDQALGAATASTFNFLYSTEDGILGLAFSTLNTMEPVQQETWFDSAVAQGMPAIFAADLVGGGPGAYDFGALSSSYSNSDISYINVDNSAGLWNFTPDSVTIGSGSSISIGAVVVDTGTTLILLADEIVVAYYALVSGAEFNPYHRGWVFDCSATMPDFTVTISGYNAVVPASLLNYAPIRDNSGTCFGGIQTRGDLPMSVFGSTFMRTQYVIFDQTTGSPRLGFTAKTERTRTK